MTLGQKVLGSGIFNHCMKLTFYGQFVAGETTVELKHSCETLQNAGIKPILCVPIEEDAGGEM